LKPSLVLSDVYWAIWIFVLFLGPEIAATTHLIPLYTLSRTSWINEDTYHWLHDLLFGFLIGLAVHIRFKTPLGHAELGGLIIALVAHSFWGLK
jgi:hypothetical protein